MFQINIDSDLSNLLNNFVITNFDVGTGITGPVGLSGPTGSSTFLNIIREWVTDCLECHP